MRKDKMRRRLVVGALAAALGAAVIASGTAQTQEVEWNAPQSTLTVDSPADVTPPAPTGREENREVEWN